MTFPSRPINTRDQSIRMTPFIVAIVALTALLVAPTTAAAQVDRVADPNWTTPRTPDGHPDLQGLWGNKTITPTERPDSAQGRAYLTDEEMAVAQQQRVLARQAQDATPAQRTTAGDRVGAYGSYWLDGGDTVLPTGQRLAWPDRASCAASEGRRDRSHRDAPECGPPPCPDRPRRRSPGS